MTFLLAKNTNENIKISYNNLRAMVIIYVLT